MIKENGELCVLKYRTSYYCLLFYSSQYGPKLKRLVFFFIYMHFTVFSCIVVYILTKLYSKKSIVAMLAFGSPLKEYRDVSPGLFIQGSTYVKETIIDMTV